MNHTQGPWFLEHDTVGDIVTGHIEVSSSTHGALALVVWKMEDEEVSPECQANARLIAAAPELLEALIKAECKLVELELSFAGGDDELYVESSILTARAAIAKATGA
jgi:hypothetical protein